MSCRKPLAEKLWSKVDRGEPDECWEWRGCIGGGGYGRLGDWDRRTTVAAHRVAYELTYGPIPEGMCACHRCDNRLCCNPDHIFIGTQKDNIRDMVAKGRNNPPCLAGEASGRAVLTEGKVREARRRFDAGGITTYALAKQFGVSPGAMYCVVHHKTWRSVA